VPRVVVVLAGLLLALLAPVAVAAAEPVTNLTPPTADGEATYRSRLVAGPGTWSATTPTYTYQWLRNGREIDGATGTSYRLTLADIGTDVAVRVTAAEDDESGSAVSAERRVRRATLDLAERPAISGTRRYLHRLEASVPRWRQSVDRVRYRWLRDGKAISGATRTTRTLTSADRHHKISLRVTYRKTGYTTVASTTAQTRTVS
jgi:hypothetical protein